MAPLVVVVAVGVVVLVVVGALEVVVVTALGVVFRLRARAGSCPVISSIVISSQVATNRASALATTRRRMPETRAPRAWRRAWPRARRSALSGR